jgi:hypothetical protein
MSTSAVGRGRIKVAVDRLQKAPGRPLHPYSPEVGEPVRQVSPTVKEEVMRARRVGNGSEFRLFQDEKEIGWVDATAVSFLGFVTQDDAALAASVAYRALVQRWPDDARPEESPTLLPPAPEEAAAGGWGFSIPLLPSERIEVFALARARVMWRALQGSGIFRRMRQFAEGLIPV